MPRILQRVGDEYKLKSHLKLNAGIGRHNPFLYF